MCFLNFFKIPKKKTSDVVVVTNSQSAVCTLNLFILVLFKFCYFNNLSISKMSIEFVSDTTLPFSQSAVGFYKTKINFYLSFKYIFFWNLRCRYK